MRPGEIDAQLTKGAAHDSVRTAGTAQQDVHRHRQPAAPAPGGQDHHIQLPVIRLRVRQQRHAALEGPHVADDDTARPAPQWRSGVGPQGDPHRPVPQVLQRGGHVGGRAKALLDVLAGVVQHLGVQTEAGHGQEQAVVRDPGVERPVAAGKRDGQGVAEVGGQTEIAGQQVAGARRNHGQRYSGAGQAGRGRGHGAIAAAGHDQIDAGPRRRPGLPFTWIFWRRFQPHRLAPAVLGHGGADRGPELFLIVELHRVHHHRRAAHLWYGLT